jgi:signal transduction histidine kinase
MTVEDIGAVLTLLPFIFAFSATRALSILHLFFVLPPCCRSILAIYRARFGLTGKGVVAGVAHEINNPVSFIYGNIDPADEYIRDLISLIKLYQNHYPQPVI